MRIFVTGGTGFLGRHLVSRLAASGHEVTLLTRRSPAGQPERSGVTLLQGDPTVAGPWQAALAGQDAVINLAGESLAGRWTAARKQRILASREEGTRNVVAAMLAANPSPPLLLQASAVGYYGARDDTWLSEEADSGQGFLAQVTRAWEAAVQPAEAAGIRTIRLRIGMVLAQDGGALPRMLPAFRAGFGAPLGSGSQYYSWIHLEDLIRLIVFCLDSPLSGAVNAVSPEPVPMRDFGRTLAQVLLRPYWPVAVPAFLVRLALGEMATVVLDGQRVRPERALQAGFTFRYPELEAALHAIMGW